MTLCYIYKPNPSSPLVPNASPVTSAKLSNTLDWTRPDLTFTLHSTEYLHLYLESNYLNIFIKPLSKVLRERWHPATFARLSPKTISS